MGFVLGLILVSSLAFSESEDNGLFRKHGSEPDGFRDMRWGTDVSALQDRECLSDNPEYFDNSDVIIQYTKKSDSLKVGNATVKDIKYGFLRRKFYSVTVRTKGYNDWVCLREAVFAEYGQGHKLKSSTPQHEMYSWRGKKTRMELRYDAVGTISPSTGERLFLEEGIFYMSSAKLQDEMQKRKENNRRD